MPNSDEINEAVRQEVRKIFSSPSIQKNILDVVDNRRPKGWSSRSYPTYYKDVYAIQLKVDIDAMIDSYEKGEPTTIVYSYDEWCGPKDSDGDRPKMSETTLYLKTNQSLRYLIDHLDTPDHKYAKWNQCVNIRRNKTLQGVTIEWSQGYLDAVMSGNEAPKARHVQPEVARPKWERQIEYYLQDEANQNPLIIENLCLTAEEVLGLKRRFATLPNVMADINGSCIRLLKMRE